MASSSTASSVHSSDNRGVSDAQGQTATAQGVAAKDSAVAQPIKIHNYGGGVQTARIDISNTTTDFGAIESGMQTAKDALGVAQGTFDKTIGALETAYADAKGGTSMFRDLALGALVVVGFAFWTLRGSK